MKIITCLLLTAAFMLITACGHKVVYVQRTVTPVGPSDYRAVNQYDRQAR